MISFTGLAARLNLVPPCLRDPLNSISLGSCLTDSLVYWLRLLLYITVAASTIYVFVGAFQMVTAYGNESKYAAGKTTITYALIGLAIGVLALVIVNFFILFLGGAAVTI